MRSKPPHGAAGGTLADRDPAVGPAPVVTLRRLLEELERLHVDSAGDASWAWPQIADALQVTRQSVHERHAASRSAQDKATQSGHGG